MIGHFHFQELIGEIDHFPEDAHWERHLMKSEINLGFSEREHVAADTFFLTLPYKAGKRVLISIIRLPTPPSHLSWG